MESEKVFNAARGIGAILGGNRTRSEYAERIREKRAIEEKVKAEDLKRQKDYQASFRKTLIEGAIATLKDPRATPQARQAAANVMNAAQSGAMAQPGSNMQVPFGQMFQRTPEPEKTTTLSSGDVLVNSLTGEEIARNQSKNSSGGGSEAERHIAVINDPGSTQAEIEQSKRRLDELTGSNEGDKGYAREAGKNLAKYQSEAIAMGDVAARDINTLTRMGDLLQSIDTGPVENAFLGLQNIASDLGISYEGLAERLGINLADNVGKSEFKRLSTALVIDGFSKFKGNLNQKEVQLAQDQFPQLGTTTQANKTAIAYLTASARIAKRRGDMFARATTKSETEGVRRKIREATEEEFLREVAIAEKELGLSPEDKQAAFLINAIRNKQMNTSMLSEEQKQLILDYMDRKEGKNAQ